MVHCVNLVPRQLLDAQTMVCQEDTNVSLPVMLVKRASTQASTLDFLDLS